MAEDGLVNLHDTFQGIKDALDEIQASLVLLNTLSGRVQALEVLLKGIERTASPDGVEGLFIPLRVGINSKYFLTQPAGQGTALTVSTGIDAVCALVQHDGAEGSDGLGKQSPVERTALKVVCTDPNPSGHNTAILSIASNAPHGNIGLHAMAQYAPDADPKVTIVKEEEWKN